MEKATSNAEFISDHLVDPGRAVFPWRHSPSPLPRLVPEDPAHVAEGGVLGPAVPPVNGSVRTAMRWNAAAALGVPLWRAALTSRWEEELAEEFSRAFRLAVAGMLANTYSVPLERISRSLDGEGGEESKTDDTSDDKDGASSSVRESFAVDFDQTLEPLPEITDIKDEIAAEERKEAAERSRGRKEEEECPEVEHMLERNLRTLYQTAHEHARHRLRIKLRTEPTSARIESLMVVPCITREHVEQTPALRHSFRNIWKQLDRRENELGRQLGMMEVGKLVSDELEKLASRMVDSDGILESTVVAQVSILCDEVFTVRDVDLDEVVQGDPGSKVNEVVHLVRFEMVVRVNLAGGGKAELGTWQITDWDDLLGGNIWFI